MLTKLFGKPTKDEFAQTIIELAQEAHGPLELTYDKERFRIIVGDPEEFTNQFNLVNVYEEYIAAGPLHRRTLLESYVMMLLEHPAQTIPDTFREAQPNLLPRVRERSYHGISNFRWRESTTPRRLIVCSPSIFSSSWPSTYPSPSPRLPKPRLKSGVWDSTSPLM